MKFAQLFGKKTVINEFVAYSELSNMIKNSLLKGVGHRKIVKPLFYKIRSRVE